MKRENGFLDVLNETMRKKFLQFANINTIGSRLSGSTGDTGVRYLVSHTELVSYHSRISPTYTVSCVSETMTAWFDFTRWLSFKISGWTDLISKNTSAKWRFTGSELIA